MEQLTEVEFKGVKLVEDNKYGFSKDTATDVDVALQFDIHQTSVHCEGGWKLTVHVQGKPQSNKPAIITYHDIGMNFGSCFQSLFCSHEMEVIRNNFTIYHITAPGQEDDARAFQMPLTEPTSYPNMDQLADQLETVCERFKLKKFIAFGAGAGANVFLRFALAHPEKVESMVLINPTARRAGWVEWGYLKLAVRYLHSGVTNRHTEDYLVWHHLGYKSSYENEDLCNMYRQSLAQLTPENLARFIQAYLERSDVGVKRELVGPGDSRGDQPVTSSITCPVLNVVGAWSPHVDESVDLNTKLNPLESTWFKVSDSGGFVQEENPCKLVEAFVLMLKGNGYPRLAQPRL